MVSILPWVGSPGDYTLENADSRAHINRVCIGRVDDHASQPDLWQRSHATNRCHVSAACESNRGMRTLSKSSVWLASFYFDAAGQLLRSLLVRKERPIHEERGSKRKDLRR